MNAAVPAAALQAFREDGVAVLRGVFADWVETLREGVEENLASPGPWSRTYTERGRPGHFFGDYCNWQRIEPYRRFVETSPLGAVAATLMSSERARFFHEHVLVKEPGTEEATPWHHDQPYYSIDGRQHVSLWIPLDDVSRSVCPEFVAGSHRWGKWFVPTRFTGQSWDRDEGKEQGLERIPDIESQRDRYRIVAFDLAPGDAIAFDFLTVHGAPANPSSTRRRRGFSARVVGDDARWAKRSGPTSPPFPELHEQLEHGASLEGVDAFPVIHPRA